MPRGRRLVPPNRPVRPLRARGSGDARSRRRRASVLLRRVPAGLHARPRVGIRSVLPARRPAAGGARAGACHRAHFADFDDERVQAEGDRGGGRPPPHAALPRGRPLRGVRVARREAPRRPSRCRRGPPEHRHRRRGDHLAPGAHAPVGHRPRARSPRLHPAHPRRLARPGGAPGRGPREPGPARRGGRVRDEPHVPPRRALRRRLLRDGGELRAVLPLVLPRGRRPGSRVLRAPVLPDGAGRPEGARRPHRPADCDRAGRDVRRERVERGSRQRAAVVRLARDARRGAAGRAAAPAERTARGARARRQPARGGVPGVRAAARRRRPRRPGRRGSAGRSWCLATGSRFARERSCRSTASSSPAARRSTTPC